ncbi:MAG: NAD(+)/NADH kinase [Coriobacteriales bacterium]|jgi:diacylglycerol kinase family enzyme|nr:NAD(+)/NADH kinase [Coriobacteriales bacterium]
MRILVVNNPLSGLRDGAIFNFVRNFLEAGDEVVLRNIDATTPIADYVKDAEDFELVVASGGDGTISAACYALRYSNIPILPFPAGTGNLLVTNLSLPDEPIALAALARHPYLVDFDMAEVSYLVDGVRQTYGFTVAAGAGFDANIMKAAANLKPTFGPGAYVLAAISRANPTYSRFQLELDDRVVTSEGIAVLLLNFAKIGPGLSITHGNNARDGLLEVTVLKPHNAVELLPALFAAFLDRDGGFPGRADAIETHLSATVRITADPPLLTQHDGETTGAVTPLDAQILPAAARLVVPAQTYAWLNP